MGGEGFLLFIFDMQHSGWRIQRSLITAHQINQADKLINVLTSYYPILFSV